MSSSMDSNDLQEEQNLLASVGTSIRSQAEYESSVIRNASHQHVPRLTGIGFPDLSTLIPQNGASSYIPHVLATLANVRHQMQYSSAEENSEEAHLVQMKYQILLMFLSNHTRVPTQDIRHNDEQEIISEKKRKRNLLFQKNLHEESGRKVEWDSTMKVQQKDRQDDVVPSHGPQALEYIKRNFTCGFDDSVPIFSTSTTASFGKQAIHSRDECRQRASYKKLHIMGMKQKLTEEDGNEWVDPVALWKKREARREKRRLKRESSWTVQDTRKMNSDNEREWEEKIIVPSKPIVNKGTHRNWREAGMQKDALAQHQQRSEKDSCHMLEREVEPVVFCSICERSICVPRKESIVPIDMDEFLCKHMSTCRGVHLRSSTSNERRKRHVSLDAEDQVMDSVKETIDLKSTQTDEPVEDSIPTSHDLYGQSEEEPKFEREVAVDDMNEDNYEDRVDEWIEVTLKQMKRKLVEENPDEDLTPTIFPGGLFVPAWMNQKLFSYQKTGVRWMWELYRQGAGGIVGDEMGLGKTVQVSAFLGAMTASSKIRSVLIICPATMMAHWLNELARWAPSLRRIMLHKSADDGGHSRKISKQLLQKMDKWLRRSRADKLYEAIDEQDYENSDPDSFVGTAYAFVTTYDNIRLDAETWQSHDWSVVILDEGQKIRNPDADVTLSCKRLKTPHRYLLSGTPIQNDLRELWSLFDFVFPGRLGTLPSFESEFADVIRKGGYSNASPMQVALGYRCALALKDIINPYLLRRQKKDVKEMSKLPGKTEHVLFCRLSKRQRILYEAYLESDAVKSAISGTGQIFKPIIVLRKICNHPDLVCGADQDSLESFARNSLDEMSDSDSAGSHDESEEKDIEVNNIIGSLVERSGKLQVLAKILPLWHTQGHRVLIFSQWKKTLNIIQRFVSEMGWNMMRMDGSTNIAARQTMVDRFNADPSIFGMLMTTRTGGVGLNLTGANRILLFDPDWNPQTDAQARERAWRYGQSKSVTVYRLIVAGTIEEKIYHRQIFKTALTNQILQDPRQRRLFTKKDLRDFFTLKADVGDVSNNGGTQTCTAEFTRGHGVISNELALRDSESDDNTNTLEAVFKCKGVAGVFDHDTVDEASAARKSLADIEMDEKARRVAVDAARAIASSSIGQEEFTPTWTGSKATEVRRFGGVQRERRSTVFPSTSRPLHGESTFGHGAETVSTAWSSSSLLDNLRKRNESIQMAGRAAPFTIDESERELQTRISKFIQSCSLGATTDQLLTEFRKEQLADANLFRTALQFVAKLRNGRWHVI